MTAPAGQNKLPNQTPNNNTPVVQIEADVSTALKDSTGKPVTGILHAFGYVTPAWRYLMGRFLTSVAPISGGGTTINDPAVWANTAGTQLKDLSWTTVTQTLLSLFTSSQPGIVPASGGGTTNFLRADGNWAAPGSGLTYLGTVSASGGVIADTTIVAANNTKYRSFLLVLENVVVTTAGSNIEFQVHANGAFQNSSYLTSGSGSVNGSAVAGIGTITTCLLLSANSSNSSPGTSGYLTASNLGSASVKKIWNGSLSGLNNAGTLTQVQTGGYWNGGNNAIDGFQIIDSHSGTDIASGSVDIYGVL